MIQDPTISISIVDKIKELTPQQSRAEIFAELPDKERQSFLDSLSEEDKYQLSYDWSFWARPKQIMPDGDWRYWLVLAGRGWGKSMTGANTIACEVEKARKSGKHLVIGLVGSTFKEIEKV